MYCIYILTTIFIFHMYVCTYACMYVCMHIGGSARRERCAWGGLQCGHGNEYLHSRSAQHHPQAVHQRG